MAAPRGRERLAIAAVAAGAVALGLTAFVHPLAPVAAVVGLWVGVLGVTNAFFGLLVFLLVLFTRPGDFVPALGPLQLAKTTALASLALFVAWRLLARDFSLRRDPANRWMFALVAAVVASCVLSTGRPDSFAAFQDVFVKILILYFLILNLVDRPSRAVVLQATIAVAAALLGAYALYAKATGTTTVEGTRAAAVGLLGDPNDLALVLLMGLPYSLLATLETGGARRLFHAVLLALVFFGIVATQSRGGILGLAAALYLVLRQRVRSRALTWIAVAGVLLGLAVMAGIGARQGLEGEGIDESAQGRLDAWGAGVRMLRYNPLLGVGFYRFSDNYFAYVVDPVTWDLKAAHNTFVQCFAETGLLGFVPFVGLLVQAFLHARASAGAAVEPGLARAVTRAQLPTLAALVVAAFFLSQAWNWFLYIGVAQAVAVRALFAPLPVHARAPSPYHRAPPAPSPIPPPAAAKDPALP